MTYATVYQTCPTQELPLEGLAAHERRCSFGWPNTVHASLVRLERPGALVALRLLGFAAYEVDPLDNICGWWAVGPEYRNVMG